MAKKPTDFGKLQTALKSQISAGEKTGISKEQTLKNIRSKLTKAGKLGSLKEEFKTTATKNTESDLNKNLKKFSAGKKVNIAGEEIDAPSKERVEEFNKQFTTTSPTKKEDLGFVTPGGVVLGTKKTETAPDAKVEDTTITDTGVTEDVIEEETIVTETEAEKTLREKVAERVAGRQTAEEKLLAAREEEGRPELIEQRKEFREEASAIREDLENIRAGLEAEGGAITKIAASRIREARSAPLREQLTSLVKGIDLTSANIKELDDSTDALLKARELDRKQEVANLTAQIEGSDLSSEEKNKLLTQLGQQTARMKREDELELFESKEQIKSDIKLKEENSIAQTGLTLDQNVTLGKIANNFGVKEDSLVAKSVASMLKEGKTEQEINKILGLATDAEGNFVDDVQFARREKLRKEFEAKAGVKSYREAVLQHQGTISTLGQASGPGDVAAVFQFMKTLDPTSVVRESEFKAAANAAGVSEKVDIGNLFQKFKNGAILGEKNSQTRKAFVETVNELFKVKKQNFDGLARQMINQAIRDGVDPKSVVLDLDEVPGASDITRDDFNLLEDDDLTEIDSIFGFTTSDGTTFNITDDFSQADQTATPKGKISGILGPLQDKVTVVEKGGDNPVLGLSGGSLTFRTNNPLAITATGSSSAERLTNKFGAIPNLFSPDSADNLVLNFKTPEEGLRAGIQLLESKGNLSINELMESHTGTAATGHKAQAQKLGLDLNTKFEDLSDEDKMKVIEAIKIGEGFRAGTTIS